MMRGEDDNRSFKFSKRQNSGLSATGTRSGGNIFCSGKGNTLLRGRYREVQTIGRGTCGVCLLTEDQSSGQIVVIKRISVIKTSSAASQEQNTTSDSLIKALSPEFKQAINEVTLFKSIDHPNIIKYYDSFIEESRNLSTIVIPTHERELCPLDKTLLSNDTSESFFGMENSTTSQTVTVERVVNIVMEFAGGGDLQNEICRRKGDTYQSNKDSCLLRLRTKAEAASADNGQHAKSCFESPLQNSSGDSNVDSHGYFSPVEIWMIFVQLLLALKYIHSHRILHRDIKASNIFITAEGVIKLGDFGIAKHINDELARTVVGSPFYMAPEIHLKNPYDEKSDIWSLGCVLFQLCTLSTPFKGSNMDAILQEILNYGSNQQKYRSEWLSKFRFDSQPHCEEAKYQGGVFLDLIFQMLCMEPKERPSASQLLDMPEILAGFDLVIRTYSKKQFGQFSHLHAEWQNIYVQRFASAYKLVVVADESSNESANEEYSTPHLTRNPEVDRSSQVKFKRDASVSLARLDKCHKPSTHSLDVSDGGFTRTRRRAITTTTRIVRRTRNGMSDSSRFMAETDVLNYLDDSSSSSSDSLTVPRTKANNLPLDSLLPIRPILSSTWSGSSNLLTLELETNEYDLWTQSVEKRSNARKICEKAVKQSINILNTIQSRSQGPALVHHDKKDDSKRHITGTYKENLSASDSGQELTPSVHKRPPLGPFRTSKSCKGANYSSLDAKRLDEIISRENTGSTDTSSPDNLRTNAKSTFRDSNLIRRHDSLNLKSKADEKGRSNSNEPRRLKRDTAGSLMKELTTLSDVNARDDCNQMGFTPNRNNQVLSRYSTSNLPHSASAEPEQEISMDYSSHAATPSTMAKRLCNNRLSLCSQAGTRNRGERLDLDDTSEPVDSQALAMSQYFADMFSDESSLSAGETTINGHRVRQLSFHHVHLDNENEGASSASASFSIIQQARQQITNRINSVVTGDSKWTDTFESLTRREMLSKMVRERTSTVVERSSLTPNKAPDLLEADRATIVSNCVSPRLSSSSSWVSASAATNRKDSLTMSQENAIKIQPLNSSRLRKLSTPNSRYSSTKTNQIRLGTSSPLDKCHTSHHKHSRNKTISNGQSIL